MTCSFLFMCTGYYRYDQGFTPELPGTDRFGGTLIHPQHWPEDLDYTGKRVVVIGSGATAVTLVPAMSDRAEHVTMLQRSPSYVLSLPEKDPLATLLRRILPARVAYPIVRWKNVGLATFFFQLSRRAPKVAKWLIRKGIEARLGADYDIDPHFKPTYEPWDQRLCLVPDGDLFKALRSGKASVATDRIKTFTETGIELESGATLDADIVVTATGLNLLALGGTQFAVDGRDVDLGETIAYKGMMLGGVPNMAFATGYTNASWTLKADLVCQYVCRLVNHMHDNGYRQVTPLAPDPSEPTHPFIDLASGYVLRSVDQFPRQGDRLPWRLHQNYPRDIAMLRFGSLEDEGIEFSNREPVPDAATAERIAA
jgi:cation diffusion facilitator CzcD-associated flavoprotein CzcO